MRTSFEEIIEAIHTIPSLPEITTRVARMAGDPATTIPQLAAVMIKDPGMAAKILRMTNSATYALRQPVTSLEQALSLLGFKTIRTIALSVSVVSLFKQEQAHFNMKAFWLHSAVAAGMCRNIATLSKVCDPETAFTFGLLKDIGKVILVENAPEETAAIVKIATEQSLSFTAAARLILQTDDTEIAAWLCQKWELGDDLVDAICYQNDLVHVSVPGMAAMNMVVEHLCALRGIRTSGSCEQSVIAPAVWKHLGIGKDAFKSVIESMTQDIAAAKELLQIVS